MDRHQKREEIDRKCRMAGCDPERAKRHEALFMSNWDVHPPQDFRDYVLERWEREELEDEEACRKTARNWRPTSKPNPITLWNCDRERQEFYRSQSTQEIPS